MPKFLQEDLKLFSGIVSDLFPTIKEEETDYGILDKAIRQVCEKSNLKDVDGEPLAPALTVLGGHPGVPGQGRRDRAILPQAKSATGWGLPAVPAPALSPLEASGNRCLGKCPLSQSCF